MKKFFAIGIALALSGCGGTLVKDADLKSELERMGYTKVLLQPKRIDCGRYGKGKHYLGTRKDGAKVLGQICYKKASDHIEYKVDINKVVSGNKAKPGIDGTPFNKAD